MGLRPDADWLIGKPLMVFVCLPSSMALPLSKAGGLADQEDGCSDARRPQCTVVFGGAQAAASG